MDPSALQGHQTLECDVRTANNFFAGLGGDGGMDCGSAPTGVAQPTGCAFWLVGEIMTTTNEPRLVCENCGSPADVILVAPDPRCPSCASSATGVHNVVRVKDGEHILEMGLNQLGLRWESLREMVLERHEHSSKKLELDAKPRWWSRLKNAMRRGRKAKP